QDPAGATHYLFAHLQQTTASLNLRLDYTLTPTMTIQLYANPFVSKGTYSNAREITSTPRAADRAARYQPYTADPSYTPGGFNFKSFNSNLVMRWEYRPGSTLFLVWQQGRQNFAGAEGNGGITSNLGDLFGLRPSNLFQIKASYW